jgi:hypothetical protein
LEVAELEIKGKCFTPAGPYLLPFSPNPRWREASVFIVGLNPISPLREEFTSYDHYWDSLVKFPEHYWGAYASKYGRNGITRSRTSIRIREFCERLHPINVLVTNVFAYPSTDPKLIPLPYRKEPTTERILTKLILACQPKVLFFHGREARLYVKEFFGVDLNPYLPPAAQAYQGWIPGAAEPSHLFGYHHFVGRVDDKNTVAQRLDEFARLVFKRVLLTE